MWPAVHIRPDIVYLVGVLSQYYSNPRPTHYLLVVQIFRYFSGILNLRIIFKVNSSNKLVDCSDSNYMGLIESHLFTSRYIFMLFDGLLSHQSKL